MKYIPAEELIAEIERQQRKLTVLSSHMRQIDMKRDCALQNGVYIYILSIIASLQQEQPDLDIENDIREYFEGWRINYYSETEELLKNNGCTVDIDDVKEIARHFWNKGYNARKED